MKDLGTLRTVFRDHGEETTSKIEEKCSICGNTTFFVFKGLRQCALCGEVYDIEEV